MVIVEDCLTGLTKLGAGSVDFVFADLPYGRTQNTWDKLVPVDRLWHELRRVCKPSAALVFTAIQPFTSLLVTTNLSSFRYEMIWSKNKSTGFLNAKKQPLRAHENILVFYDKPPTYKPQMTNGHRAVNSYTQKTSGSNYGRTKPTSGGGSTERYPNTILAIPVVNNDAPERLHCTQKPTALVKWFINTYTQPGDLVLDPTAGSGSTGIAALQTGRRFVGYETDPVMARSANAWLARNKKNLV